jgi:transposase
LEKDLTMSPKERRRIDILCQIGRDEITVTHAASELDIGERQMYRILKRYQSQGEAGLCHQLRGRPSNRRFSRDQETTAMRLFREQYSDYGATLFAEKLEEYHKIVVSRPTVTRWLKNAHLYIRQRERRRHRRKRDRRNSMGEMLQLDGSHHKWFEERGKPCSLIVIIDDASSRQYLHFAESENTRSVFDCMRGYIERYGLPGAIYTDHGSVYYDTEKPKRLTEYGRVLQTLGIEPIYARSPQAKGRVERANRTLQDRLLKALREQNISTIEAANMYLMESFIDLHNKRFSQPEGLPDIHRAAAGINLDTIFCYQTTRCVNYDYTFSLNTVCHQLEPSAASMPAPRSRVIVQQWFDGSTHVFWNEQQLTFSVCKSRPKPKAKPRIPPSAHHPWRHRHYMRWT